VQLILREEERYMQKKLFLGVGLFLITLLLSPTAYAEVKIEGLKLYGDLRGRYESDTQTRSNAGAYQDRERGRFRYRLRAGFASDASEYVEIGGRLASGTGVNSPHVILGSDTNSDNTSGNFSKDSITIDKAYIKGKYLNGFLWFGKNDVPFWEQNEYFWDADVNPEGIGLGYTIKGLGPASIILQGGRFTVNEIGWKASGGNDDSTLLLYQGVIKAGFDFADFTVGYGVGATDDGVSTTTDVSYSLLNIQANIKAIANIPITVGYDLISSDDKTKISGTKADGSGAVSGSGNEAKTGSVINLGVSFGNFNALLMLTDIEKYATTPFALDDWPNYQNDFTGTEIRLGYKIAKNMNVDLRNFSGAKKTDSGLKEGRTQINLNVSF
jgi:hypothetical protein